MIDPKNTFVLIATCAIVAFLITMVFTHALSKDRVNSRIWATLAVSIVWGGGYAWGMSDSLMMGFFGTLFGAIGWMVYRIITTELGSPSSGWRDTTPPR